MGFAVVHMMKIKSGAVGGIQSHNNREHEPKTNPDVDMLRSHENYDLVPCDNYRRAIKEKLSDLVESGRAVRKDAVVVCNFIVTSDSDTMEALGADRQRAFFEDAVKWFSDRYGADRVLNATVHMDENTPHLHIGVMPITQDGRLSAKAIFTKTELKAIQTEFARDVGARYGLERGVEGSERTHLSEARFKEEKALQMANEYAGIAQDLQRDAEDSRQELAEATRSLETVKQEISSMEAQKTALRGEIEGLEAQKTKVEQVTQQALLKLKEQKPIIQQMLDQKAEMERELPVLSAQISEAKSELAVVETAIKRKMDEGERLFSRETLQGELRAEREKMEREARISLFERFLEFPGVRPLWERFVAMIEQERWQKRGFKKSKDEMVK